MESRDSSPCSPLACSYPEPHKSCSLILTIFIHATFYYQYALYSYSCQVASLFQVFQLKSCCTFFSVSWASYVPNPSHSASFDHSLRAKQFPFLKKVCILYVCVGVCGYVCVCVCVLPKYAIPTQPITQ